MLSGDAHKSAKWLISAILLAAILGGGNFVTALSSLIFSSGVLVYCLLKKTPKKLATASIFVVMLTGFLLSALSPGNAIRQQSHTRTGSILSIGLSLIRALTDIKNFSNLKILLIFLLMTPLIYTLAGRAKFRFKYPVLFVIFTFLCFAAQNAPPIFAMGRAGEGRLRDIVFYSYFWFVLLNLFYLMGFFQRRFKGRAARLKRLVKSHQMRFARPAVTAALIAVLALVILNPAALKQSSSGSCLLSLKSGQARQYGSQMQERLIIYKDKNITDVLLEPISSKPIAICYGDITTDATDWHNRAVAEYYGKKTVTLDSGADASIK